MTTIPPPGSHEAIEAGCICPVFDNAHGRGVPLRPNGEAAYWVNEGCPLHCPEGSLATIRDNRCRENVGDAHATGDYPNPRLRPDAEVWQASL